MEFFDANCMVGPRTKRQPGGLAGEEEVLAELRRCGVGRALVHHALAREWAPAHGNAELAAITTRHPEALGCWVALPPATGEVGSAAEFVARMLAGGGVAARLFPDATAHRFRLAEETVGPLLAALAARRVPLFVETQAPDWAALARLLERWPALPIVLVGIAYRWARDLYPLLDRHSNLHVETSTFVAHDGIQDVVRRFGVERVLFGTNAPLYAVGAAVARVALADLPEAAKSAIAHGNLDGLVAGVRR